MITTGESGRVLSQHCGDLAPPWSEGKAITLARSEAELKQNGAQELVFSPQ